MNCLSENIEVVYIPLVGAFVILPGFEFAAEARLKDWVFKVYAYACARCLEFFLHLYKYFLEGVRSENSVGK